MKLYEVHIDVYAYVLAKDEVEAAGYADEISRTEPVCDLTTAHEVTPRTALAWPGNCLVYGAKKDTTLAEAVAQYAEGA